MANKYLEKVALLSLISGYNGAKEGDKLGGTLTGFVTGSTAGAIGGKLGAKVGGLPGSAAGLIGESIVGGYHGGKLYSKLKHRNEK